MKADICLLYKRGTELYAHFLFVLEYTLISLKNGWFYAQKIIAEQRCDCVSIIVDGCGNAPYNTNPDMGLHIGARDDCYRLVA